MKRRGGREIISFDVIIQMSLHSSSISFVLQNNVSKTSYITLDDLHEVLSANNGTMDEEIMTMWQDGMKVSFLISNIFSFILGFQAFPGLKGGIFNAYFNVHLLTLAFLAFPVMLCTLLYQYALARNMKEFKCKDKDRLTFEDFGQFLKGQQQAPKNSVVVGALQRAGTLRRLSQTSLESLSSSGESNERRNSIRILAAALSVRDGSGKLGGSDNSGEFSICSSATNSNLILTSALSLRPGGNNSNSHSSAEFMCSSHSLLAGGNSSGEIVYSSRVMRRRFSVA